MLEVVAEFPMFELILQVEATPMHIADLARSEAIPQKFLESILLNLKHLGLLDSRRSLTHPPCLFAPFNCDPSGGFTLRRFYRSEICGKRVLLADDVRNTGDTFARCAALVAEAGGTVMATAAIYDRLEAVIDLGVPNIALAEYKAPPNDKVGACPLCDTGIPITRF